MSYNPDLHHRRSIRLPGYDYGQSGAYFVTLVAFERFCLFGEIVDGGMRLTAMGEIIADEWPRSAEIRAEIELDYWVIMPNHIHGIIIIKESTDIKAQSVGAHGRASLPIRKPRTLGSIIAGFKSITTKRINELRGTPGKPVWQRNYYEHIIRDEADLARIREYILGNPARWDEDQENPAK